ncbi:MAG TPA: hypothetical protein PKY59_06810 [Pyrinomonadaceae bacterium]|nr:hypothetical protein [Pyrinomonadaceae bacterium]
MINKGKIKVIKKGEVQAPETVVKVENTSKKAAAREMVSTVTNWVSEFQRNKREETKLAFEKLFAPQPQVSES